MAFEIPGFSFTLVSAADYRTGNGQYRFVRVDGTGKGVQTVAGEGAVGVRQVKCNTDEAMTVVNSGISFVEAGAAVPVGSLVASDATGRAVPATLGAVVTGVAMETASAAGILIGVLLHHSSATSA